MRSKLLLTTAVLSVALGAGGIAVAQDRSDDRQTIQPDRTQNQNKLNENRRPQTTGQAPSSTQSPSSSQTQNAPASTTQPQSSGSSQGGTAQSNQPSNSQSPSSAQTNQPAATSRPSSAQSNQPSANRPSSAQTNPPSSTQQPSSAQTAPSNQTRQPSTAAGSQSGQQPSTAQQQGTTTNRQAGGEQAGTRLSASLQASQKTRLTEAVRKLNVRPITNVNFSVSVGTAIPHSVTLHPVPAEIVAVIPQYRGYDYFVVRDEIVVVEPRSHKIVDVIERSGGARAQSTTETTRRKLNLSSRDKEIIRKHYSTRATTGSAPRTRTKVIVGEEAPSSVEIHSFPEDVYREVPAVREYRYIEGDRGTYLVEPGSRRVIEEIDEE